MIKLIIFDLSDVCFTCEEGPYLQEYAQKHHLDFLEFDRFYEELLKKAEVGEISADDLWLQIIKKFHLPLENARDIAADMVQRFRHKKEDTLTLIKRLRQHYKIAYLTNYNEIYWEFVHKKFDLSEYFDDGIVSFQIKARKPDLAGFKALLYRFQVQPQEAVFTDDSPKNLINARDLGIHVIPFKDAAQLEGELKKLGVKV